jgi:hypothetical protein
VLNIIAGKGNPEMIKYLIDHGIDIKMNGVFALQASLTQGNLNVFFYLVDCGLNINKCTYTFDYMFKCCLDHGYYYLIDYLRHKYTWKDKNMIYYLMANTSDPIKTRYLQFVRSLICRGFLWEKYLSNAS